MDKTFLTIKFLDFGSYQNRIMQLDFFQQNCSVNYLQTQFFKFPDSFSLHFFKNPNKRYISKKKKTAWYDLFYDDVALILNG